MKKILFASALALVFVACKKDKDEDTATPITMQSLSGTYAMGAVTVKMGTSPEQDVTNSVYDPCEKDDHVTLASTGTVTYIDAGTRCSPPGDGTGTWSLTAGNTKISMDGVEMTIQSFTNNVLKLTETETISGMTYTYTITYNKQ